MDEAAPPLALTRRAITSIVVIALALFGAYKGFQFFKAMKRASTRAEGGALPPLVRTEIAVRSDYTEILRGFGRARALRRAVIVAEVEGVIRSVDPRLEIGNVILPKDASNGVGTVPQLPVLVTIDDRDLNDQLERARADAAGASAEIARLGTNKGALREQLAISQRELETAERELARITPLVPQTFTQSDLDAQRLQVTLRERSKILLASQIRENADAVKVTEARIASLNRTIALAERQKGRAQVATPFAGRIEARHVVVGTRVRVGDPLFTIVDLSKVEVPVALPAGRYAELSTTAAARLRLPDQADPLWEGTVSRIAPGIETEQRTFYAFIVVEGTPGENPAPPGAHVIAEIDGRVHKDVIAVPRRAFLGARMFVAVPDGTHTANPPASEGSNDPADVASQERWIVSELTPQVVRYLPGVALVREGLEPGATYLVTNLESVAEGSQVRVAPEAK